MRTVDVLPELAESRSQIQESLQRELPRATSSVIQL